MCMMDFAFLIAFGTNRAVTQFVKEGAKPIIIGEMAMLKIEIAKNMLSLGIDEKIIKKTTGLSLKQIEDFLSKE